MNCFGIQVENQHLLNFEQITPNKNFNLEFNHLLFLSEDWKPDKAIKYIKRFVRFNI